MQEIKFRAIFDGKIVEYIKWRDGNWEYSTDQKTWYFEKKYAHSMVQQYIGLHDKNGKEIYKGDIVIFKRSGYVSGNWTGIGVIEWEKYHTKFHYVMKKTVEGECYDSWNLFPDTDYKVIGNIYENPELLENKK
jgi:uncharacterized phage protein (TIGR01671 family)